MVIDLNVTINIVIGEVDSQLRIKKKQQNAPRPSEHPPVRGGKVKTFRWDHRLQIKNLFMVFNKTGSPILW